MLAAAGDVPDGLLGSNSYFSRREFRSLGITYFLVTGRSQGIRLAIHRVSEAARDGHFATRRRAGPADVESTEHLRIQIASESVRKSNELFSICSPNEGFKAKIKNGRNLDRIASERGLPEAIAG